MKYETVIYVRNEEVKEISIRNYTQVQLEKMELEGQFRCPGKECSAKLCLVHNSKNGGRTSFFKALDDDTHHLDCEYRIGNYKTVTMKDLGNGYFTESQINANVKSVDRDVRDPLSKNARRQKNKNKVTNKRTGSKDNGSGETVIRKTSASGRIIYGEESVDGNKGRMSRAFNVTDQDVGKWKTIYGNAKQITLDEYGQLHVRYNEERLDNIEVLVGPIIEHNYPFIYENLHVVERYFNENIGGENIFVTAGGLVNKRNGKLVLELQTDKGILTQGATIRKLVANEMSRII